MLGVAAAALVIDPLGACGDSDFRYGVEEMRGAVAGEWHDAEVGGKTYDLTIDVADAPSGAHGSAGWVHAACGHRDLVRQAGPCVDLTSLPLTVAGRNGERFDGSFDAIDLDFSGGELRVRDGDRALFEVALDEHGNVRRKPNDVVLVRTHAAASAHS